MRTSERAQNLYDEEDGAIMVMGIFMCSCLVGALWYLAGIGDAILLRERAQEAADAAAFSDAALHARGMNLIVLINLVMACILGVRVALQIARTVLLLAGALFGSLGFLWPPLYALAAPCMAAAQTLQQVIEATRQPIDKSLEALGLVQDQVATLTPKLATLGTQIMIGPKYTPTITRIGVAQFGDGSLPVAKGTQDKLCKEAGYAAGLLVAWSWQKSELGSIHPDGSSWLGDKFRWIAGTSPQYFCGIGSATGDPDMNELFHEAAVERCKGGPDKEKEAFDETEKAWERKCAEYGVTCKGTDDRGEPLDKGTQTGTTLNAEQQMELDRFKLVRDQTVRSTKERRERFGNQFFYPTPKCVQWAAEDAKDRRAEQDKLEKEQQKQKGEPDEKSEIAPKQIDPNFQNGGALGQVAGGALFDASRLARSSRLVRVGAFADRRARAEALEGSFLPSWAQAEFFFDCSGKWAECNAEGDAMWHLRWRARLRRWNEPEPVDVAIAEMGLANGHRIDLAGFAQTASATPHGLHTPNPALREELGRALQASRQRGVH